ncbi:family 1 glycosylhydrolase [Curtobacterium sp. RRHDQ10]|uniref:family 1 glycosylhydrolase n=1 Tax=Curtobacterium phyllosphaerae TaxID=3413379 RepID=UPI003BF0A66E
MPGTEHGPGDFAWIAGIEDTSVVPPARFDMAPLDEHDLTEHTSRWRTDLDAVRDLGVTALRYGVRWPVVHLAPGVFDWAELDERLTYASSLGLTVIADLVHYGTPTWLEDSFADPRYVDAIAEFSAAFATRYRGVVDHLTPLNEPLTTASFAGLRGVWPPALTGWDGWTTVTVALAEGIVASVEAIRAANPDATIVHVEAGTMVVPDDDGLVSHAALLTDLGWLATDLVLGLVGSEHPMRAWLVEHGADPVRLDRLRHAPARLDLLGVNYYPDLTPRTLRRSDAAVADADADGDGVVQVATNRWTDGLRTVLCGFADRYGLPIVVTETSIEGSDRVRSDWVLDSTRTVLDLVAEGVDIRGYTWWPVFDFVDWSYASGGRNVEEFGVDESVVRERQAATSSGVKTPFLRRMGLIRLEEQSDGSLARVATAAAEQFRAVTASERA